MAAPEFATLTTDDLVTGEAVALDLPPASLGVRLASGLVDVLATGALLLVVIFTFLVAALRADGALAHVAFVGTLVVVFLVFPTTVETLSRGKSLGKWAFGLRAVRDDAGPISFQHAFVRALVGFVEIYATGGGAGVLLRDAELARQAARRLRRGHLRRPRAGPAPARAAPADAARAGGAGRGRPTSRRCRPGWRWRSASSWRGCPGWTRLPCLGRQRRWRSRCRSYVAPPPPPGTPPEAFLAAVVATRRERDQARLGRERAFRERLTARRS